MGLCWIDHLRWVNRIHLIDRLGAFSPRRHLIFTAIINGLIIYGIAILPLLFTVHWRLAFQRPIILIAVGISWTLFFYLICAQNYKQQLALLTTTLRKCEVNLYEQLKSKHLKTLGENRKYFIASASFWVINFIIVCADLFEVLPNRLPSPLRGLPPEWRLIDYRLSLFSLGILGFAVTLLICTTGWFIISHSSFLARISRLKYIDSPYIYFLRLRPLLRINMIAAFSWSVGVALVAYFYRNGHAPTLIISVLILQTVATYAFFMPTWLFQKKLRRIGLRRIKILVSSAKPQLDPLPPHPSRWSDLLLLEEQIAKQAADPSFNIWLRYFGYLLTTFIIPLLTAIIGTLLTKLFEP